MDASPDCPPRVALYTRSFVALLCLQLAYGFSFSTFFLLPKFMAVELGATPAAIGAVTSMFGLSGVLAIPLLNVAIDRVAYRLLLRLGSALMVLSAVGFSLVREPGAMAAVLRFLQGLSWAMTFTVGMALTSHVAPLPRMAEALGILGSSSLVMNAIAPAVVEPLADRVGFAAAFLLAGITATIATALSFFFDEPVNVRRRARTSLAVLLGRPSSRMMAVVAATAGIAFGVMFTFHQPFALAVGIHRVRAFFIAYTIGALFVRFGLAGVADRLGRHAVSVVALALYGAAVIGMQWLTQLSLALFGGLFGFAHGFFFPAFNAMMLETAQPEERGQIMVLSNGFFSVGTASVLGLGFAVHRIGYPAAFRVTGVATMAAALFLLAWPRIVGRSRPVIAGRPEGHIPRTGQP